MTTVPKNFNLVPRVLAFDPGNETIRYLRQTLFLLAVIYVTDRILFIQPLTFQCSSLLGSPTTGGRILQVSQVPAGRGQYACATSVDRRQLLNHMTTLCRPYI